MPGFMGFCLFCLTTIDTSVPWQSSPTLLCFFPMSHFRWLVATKVFPLKNITVLQVFLCVFTRCPYGVVLQLASAWLCSLCLEPTSSHWPPGWPFSHSHTSASSLQGAVTFQANPTLPSLIWFSAIETEMLWSILSTRPVNNKHCKQWTHSSDLFIWASRWHL